MKTTKEKLVEIRKSARLSRAKLSEISGFNARTIECYENTKTPPSNDYIKFCSIYFGYKMSSIMVKNNELEKMTSAEQTLKIFFTIMEYSNWEISCFLNGKILDNKIDMSDMYLEYMFENMSESRLEEIILRFLISKDEYTPKKYAEYVKTNNLVKSTGINNELDIRIITLLNSVSDEVKKSIISLLETQIKVQSK